MYVNPGSVALEVLPLLVLPLPSSLVSYWKQACEIPYSLCLSLSLACCTL